MSKNKMRTELKTEIGQHFLVDESVMEQVVDAIPESHTIVEIGAGSGLLTKHLVKKADKVIATEIDRGFKDDLESISGNGRLSVVIGNALDLLDKNNFNKIVDKDKSVWVVGNIPYHITEPLLMSLIKLPISGATILTGGRLANEISSGDEGERFGKLTLLTNTFFYVDVVGFVDKESFEPPPRTTSAIVVLKNKEAEAILESEYLYVLSRIFLSAERGTLTKNVIREAVISYNEYKQKGTINWKTKPLMTKNEAREIINSLEIKEDILDKSAEQLNNEEFKELSDKLHALSI